VSAGDFRHDLFYRLCTFKIELPPLRQRRDDIPALARHFAANVSSGRATLAEETIAELQRRPWYGNVRELRNAVEHALVLVRSGAALPVHLPEPMAPLPDRDSEHTAPLTTAIGCSSSPWTRTPIPS
jgi:two-component system nitrogen regulation response regulator GlnG